MYNQLNNQPADYSFDVTADHSGERLDKFLAACIPDVSRSKLQRWIECGAVTVESASLATTDEVVRGANYRVRLGDQVQASHVAAQESAAFLPEAITLNLAFDSPDCVVVNKPAGLVTHPAPGNWSGTLLNGLLHFRVGQASLPRAGIVHRLDKDTSGLMVVASTEPAMKSLTEQIAVRTMERRYLAVLTGRIADRGTIDKAIGRDPGNRLKMAVTPKGKAARTHWRVLGRSQIVQASGKIARSFALVECKLDTGRTHQIRVHMQSIGCPIVGDEVYGGYMGLERQALHAWRLAFMTSAAKPLWQITKAAPPEDFLALCRDLNLPDLAQIAATSDVIQEDFSI